jgi:hypothetical protein
VLPEEFTNAQLVSTAAEGNELARTGGISGLVAGLLLSVGGVVLLVLAHLKTPRGRHAPRG